MKKLDLKEIYVPNHDLVCPSCNKTRSWVFIVTGEDILGRKVECGSCVFQKKILQHGSGKIRLELLPEKHIYRALEIDYIYKNKIRVLDKKFKIYCSAVLKNKNKQLEARDICYTDGESPLVFDEEFDPIAQLDIDPRVFRRPVDTDTSNSINSANSLEEFVPIKLSIHSKKKRSKTYRRVYKNVVSDKVDQPKKYDEGFHRIDGDVGVIFKTNPRIEIVYCKNMYRTENVTPVENNIVLVSYRNGEYPVETDGDPGEIEYISEDGVVYTIGMKKIGMPLDMDRVSESVKRNITASLL